MGWKIFGLLVSIALIVGGLSGELVLRGTDSSSALVVVGFLFLIWDIISIATHKKKMPETEENHVEANGEPLSDGLNLVADIRQVDNGQRDEINSQGVSSNAALLPLPKYNGIQWFIKVLKHYADFSGRARRTEYWMFTLFNIIFYFAWAFLMGIIFGLTDSKVETLYLVIYIYPLILMLPGLAVSVRRLHDLGKSGWMMLVAFIPLIGSIWLLILMITEGNSGENKYGPNPKIWQKPLTEKIKLKSVAITLIVAASLSITACILQMIGQSNGSYSIPFNIMNLLPVIVGITLLVIGIFLLSEQTIHGLHAKGKHAFLLILITVSILCLVSFYFLIQKVLNGLIFEYYGWIFIMNNIIIFLYYLSIVLFAASHLYIKQNRHLVRWAAIGVIVFAGLNILGSILSQMGSYGNMMYNSLNMLYLLLPIAYLLLAWTYLSGKGQSVPVSVLAEAPSNERVTVPRFDGDRNTPYFILEHKVGSRYHNAGEHQKIISNQIEIGRDFKCEVRFDENFETVSRRHAAIVSDKNNWKLIPLSQTNPSFVNGKIVHKEWYLLNGDEIQCAVNGPKLVFRTDTNDL